MKVIAVIFGLIFALPLFAQGIGSGLEAATIGPTFTNDRKSNFSGFIGKSETTIFTIDYLAINRKKQEINLNRFHLGSLELIDSRDIYSVIYEDLYNEPNEIFYQNNLIFLFSDVNGIKDKYNLVYLELFNEYGEKISGRVIDTVSVDETYIIEESIEKEGFIIAKHSKFDNIFEQSIALTAVNNLGGTAWKTVIKSPVSLQTLSIESIIYSQHAPLYILCDYGFDPSGGSVRENTSELIKSKYTLWAYDHQKNFLKEFDLRLKNRWINGIELALNSDHELIISGFINETRKQTINGVFSLKISPSMTVLTSSYYKYKRAFYEKFVDTKQLDKTKELDDIELRNCIVLEDGSYFLLGEHYYHYTERNYDPRTNITTTTENYNYNSIIVAYFDPNGNHLWSDRIPKFQHTINDYGYYSSFASMRYKNDIYIFFNDTERNNDLGPTDYFDYESLSQNRKFQISYVHIQEDGVKSRGALVPADNNFMLRAVQCYQIDPTEFFLFGEVGKSGKLFSVKPKNAQ